MASKKQQLDTLKNVALFSNCSRKELEHVAKVADEVVMTEGTLIMDQGQMGREAFVIIDGEVTVRRNNRKVATLGPGDVVGEMSLLDKGPRTASVVAASEVTMLVIDARRFFRVLEDIPAINAKLLAALAGRIREFDRQTYG